jgi:hypothetical protein
MNKLFILSILFWGLLGGLLSAFGINVIDKPLQFFAIILTVFAIEITARLRG